VIQLILKNYNLKDIKQLILMQYDPSNLDYLDEYRKKVKEDAAKESDNKRAALFDKLKTGLNFFDLESIHVKYGVPIARNGKSYHINEQTKRVFCYNLFGPCYTEVTDERDWDKIINAETYFDKLKAMDEMRKIKSKSTDTKDDLSIVTNYHTPIISTDTKNDLKNTFDSLNTNIDYYNLEELINVYNDDSKRYYFDEKSKRSFVLQDLKFIEVTDTSLIMPYILLNKFHVTNVMHILYMHEDSVGGLYDDEIELFNNLNNGIDGKKLQKMSEFPFRNASVTNGSYYIDKKTMRVFKMMNKIFTEVTKSAIILPYTFISDPDNHLRVLHFNTNTTLFIKKDID